MKPLDPATVLDLLAQLVAEKALPIMLARVAATNDNAQLVAINEALGCSRRHACDLARAGRIPGAVMVAKLWRAPRKGIDAYLATRGRRARTGAVEADNDATTDDDVLRELGFARRP